MDSRQNGAWRPRPEAGRPLKASCTIAVLPAHPPPREEPMTTGTRKEIYELGELPPLGEVPEYMYAQVIRRERFGQPAKAFAREKVPVPEIGPKEALVYVMAAGINYNNVWAALGSPVDVIRVHAQLGDESGFHIG